MPTAIEDKEIDGLEIGSEEIERAIQTAEEIISAEARLKADRSIKIGGVAQ